MSNIRSDFDFVGLGDSRSLERRITADKKERAFTTPEVGEKALTILSAIWVSPCCVGGEFCVSKRL